MKNHMRDGMMGLIVGDALGVPVEFTSRRERQMDPVMGMREYGTYHQPAGTWSDDSSMALATLDSIVVCGGIQPKAIMENFVRWYEDAEYTPFDEVFDCGNTCAGAIENYMKSGDAATCGLTGDRDNGNGSLMRILPVCVWLYERKDEISMWDIIDRVENVSALTHGHLRSRMACGFTYFLVQAILAGTGDLRERLRLGMEEGNVYYNRIESAQRELPHFSRLADLDLLGATPEEEISSGGYVMDSLEAALWCLWNTDSYEAAVLAAVNLGRDTDTTAAITGGLAGLYYGADAIPAAWRDCLQRKEWIEKLLDRR